MQTAAKEKPLLFVPDLFQYHRRKTRVVKVGKVGVGGDNPIRLQSMTTTPTTDVQATVAQSIRMIDAGCEIVRITAPTMADARALGEIRKQLDAKGHQGVPLVADIHFNPECALEAANHVEKIRVNPGNYADSKAFKVKEYSDSDYEAELRRIEERFNPLVLKCQKLGRSMRIGVNHGSLSDRILNRYGDTPLGMVESALEFVRICQKNRFLDLILSMKASNVKVMIEAYRLLVARMEAEAMDYPLHLGVTEAGYGEDGRIKSAIGIGSLLNDGIGDTIRVSLTEDPEFEIPVARAIAAPYQPGNETCRGGPQSALPSKSVGILSGSNEIPFDGKGAPRCAPTVLSHVPDFYSYARRPTRELSLGPIKIGGEQPVRVFSQFSKSLLDGASKPGSDAVPEVLEWTIDTPETLVQLQACRKMSGGPSARVAFFGRFTDLALAKDGLSSVHLTSFTAPRTLPDAQRFEQLKDFLRAARSHGVAVMLESGSCHRGYLEPARNMLRGIEVAEKEGVEDLLLSFNLPTVHQLVANVRLVVALMRQRALTLPSPTCGGRGDSKNLPRPRDAGEGWGEGNYPMHLRFPNLPDCDEQRLQASVAFGSLLCDGIGDSVGLGSDPTLICNILQGAGVRITKTEFVSCPSCGRTLFDLQKVTERIKQKTGHLKGVKIAIMGCIVNGPGEMADADFGYVGGAPGRINLYVGKNCIEKGVPFDDADERLIQLIKSHGKWTEPSPGKP
jgi:(E)-4-hydroxy-3-methylbut-2-enyl-diphosphate synthase